MPSASSSSSSSSSSSPPRLLLPSYTPATRAPPPSVGRYRFLGQNFDRSAAISPFSLKMSIGLRRYRHFGSNSQQACGDIAIFFQNVNRPAAISPFWLNFEQNVNRLAAISWLCFKMAIGLRRYRLWTKLRAKLEQACGDIAILVQNVNRLVAISTFKFNFHQNFNRHAAISPFRIKTATGMWPYRLYDPISPKISTGLLQYLPFVISCNMSAEMTGFVWSKFVQFSKMQFT